MYKIILVGKKNKQETPAPPPGMALAAPYAGIVLSNLSDQNLCRNSLHPLQHHFCTLKFYRGHQGNGLNLK